MSAKKKEVQKTEAEPVELVYAGLRISSPFVDRAEIYQCFRDGEKDLFYTGIRGWLVEGRKYRAERSAKGVTIRLRPEEIGEADIDESTLAAWRDQTVAAEQFKRDRRETKRARDLAGKLSSELRPLIARAEKLPMESRHYFADAVARLIVRGIPKK